MKYRIIFDDELQDEVFNTEEDAEEYALYLRSCARTGAETLHQSNPRDYDYNEDELEPPEYEIIEEEQSNKCQIVFIYEAEMPIGIWNQLRF